MQIFAENRFDDVARARIVQMRKKIHDESPDYLLNVNQEEYLNHLVSDFEIEPLVMDFDGLFVDTAEKRIRAERFPGGGFDFAVERGESYIKQAIIFHIPFSGDQGLLNLAPNPFLMNSHEVEVRDGCVCFEIVDFYGNPEAIKRDQERILGLIRTQHASLTKNVADYNASLRTQAKALLDERRGQLQSQNQVVAALGLPIKKAGRVPSTFAVPTVRKKVMERPEVRTRSGPPEPTVEQAVYEEILKTIHDTGRVFERLPGTYADKDEETLRDHVILQLEPRFEGSTTGETFNKSGKTDILIRHEKRNVFVAECKFWHGEKKHHEAIDQILSYLTWRDSKTALVYFVRTKEMIPILRTIEESTPKHPCFTKLKGKREDSWFSHEFHLPGDPERVLQLAILCFHLPKK